MKMVVNQELKEMQHGAYFQKWKVRLAAHKYPVPSSQQWGEEGGKFLMNYSQSAETGGNV